MMPSTTNSAFPIRRSSDEIRDKPFDSENATPGSAKELLDIPLPGLRSLALDAVQHDQLTNLPKILERYRRALEAAARAKAGNTESLSRLESEHAQFQDHLRTRLLALRFSIQKDLERLSISKRYGTSEKITQGVDMQA